MLMKYTKACLGVLLCLGATQVIADAKVGDKAPDFSTTIDAPQISLHDDYVGKKPILLVFWATWCPNCLREIPQINELYKALGDQLPILAINIGINDSAETARAYQKKHGMNYPVIFDEGSRITNIYKVTGTPTQIIVGTNGKILYRDINTPTVAAIKAHWAELITK